MIFIKTILIILLIYFGIKIIFRFAFPYFMRYVARKAGEKMEQAFNPEFRRSETTPNKEGKVVIDKIPSKSKNSNKPVGDYVDYEEID